MEPFPSMLQHHIQNEQQCGLNNPHVLNFVCEPIRGLVPDSVWLDWQMARGEQVEMAVETQDVFAPLPSLRALNKSAQPAANAASAGFSRGLALAGIALQGSKF
jgi:hypothetical protein